jgi:hypothetical protein
MVVKSIQVQLTIRYTVQTLVTRRPNQLQIPLIQRACSVTTPSNPRQNSKTIRQTPRTNAGMSSRTILVNTAIDHLKARRVCRGTCSASKVCIVAGLHTVNVSSASTCQLSCQLSCNGQLSCQLRCNLSAQLHSVSCADPLPSLTSILPPKMWAGFLVATKQSRVYAVTVQCIHSMTRTLPQAQLQ